MRQRPLTRRRTSCRATAGHDVVPTCPYRFRPSFPLRRWPFPPSTGISAVGATPGFVAISPDGRLAYIARRAAGVVTVLDTSINKVVADVPIPAGPPQFIAFAPDGSRAYVSVYNADLTINAVAVLDTRTTKLVETIPVNKKPYALAVSPDQKFVYVPSHDAAVIDIIDIAANKVVQSVPVAPNPHWVTFDADGTFAYIANHDSNLVSVMETASNTVIDTIDVGISPHSIAVSPDGKQVAVVCFDSNDVYFIDTADPWGTGHRAGRQEPPGPHLLAGRAVCVHRECGRGHGFGHRYREQDGHRDHPDRLPDQHRGAPERPKGICHQPQRRNADHPERRWVVGNVQATATVAADKPDGVSALPGARRENGRGRHDEDGFTVERS